MDHDPSQHDLDPKGFWGSRYSIGLVVLGGIAAYFLLTEHRAHFFAALPFLLLLACPLMHVFMHRGHGGRAGGHGHQHNGPPHRDTSAPAQPPKSADPS